MFLPQHTTFFDLFLKMV